MHGRVAIVGGGIAGLSAAHELVERGFEVHVYERRPFFGGKAASYRVPPPSAESPSATDPPGEHGFRFFPGWYRHVTDTMARIPYHPPGGGRRTVADNLVSVRTNLLAWFDRPPIELPLHTPSSVDDAITTSRFIAEFSGLDITAAEIALFVKKLVEFLLTSDEKRAAVFEKQTWWDYLECSKPGRSRAYQDLVRATTRTSIAAKAEEVSAYTIGRLVIRTLVDTASTVDRVLNGPTAEVWINPWVAHLRARGVTFHTDVELETLNFAPGSRKVQALVVKSVVASHGRRLRKRITEGMHDDRDGKDIVDAVHVLERTTGKQAWRSLATTAKELCAQKQAALTDANQARKLTDDKSRSAKLKAASKKLEEIQSGFEVVESSLAQLEADPATTTTVDADYFVLALPLEQLAYYVNRVSMLTFLQPELRNVIKLSRNLDWMAGVQFYFQVPLDVAPGHIVGLDSDWALTAVEHTQFWKDVALAPQIRAILSVDISAWDRKGRTVRKEAFNCTPDEVAREAWAQLKEMLNRRSRSPVLREDMLVGGGLIANVSYHLDDTVVERFDRKKQAAYERSRGLSFGTLVEDASTEGQTDGFVWGPHRLFNAEPLLINRVGTRQHRPEVSTGIPNLFLAADYAKTDTDLACMEGANEAARRAVNGILEDSGSLERPCDIWPFSPSRQAVEAVMAFAAPTQAVRTVTGMMSRLQGRFLQGFKTSS